MRFDDIPEQIEAIRVAVQQPKHIFSDRERNQLQNIEEPFIHELEQIFFSPIEVGTLYTDFFTTTEGQRVFFEYTHIRVPAGTPQQVHNWLLQNRKLLIALTANQRDALCGGSEQYCDEVLYNYIQKSFQGTPLPLRMQYIIAPENALNNLKQLQSLLSRIQKISMQQTNDQSVRSLVFTLYRKRIEEMLQSFVQYQQILEYTAEHIGATELTNAEQELLKEIQYAHIISPEFILTPALLRYTDTIEQRTIQNTARQEARMNLFQPRITVEQCIQWSERVLQQYGILSAEPATTFTPDRSGAASDNQWQVIARQEYRSLAVEPRQHIVKIPLRPTSAHELIAVIVGHEIEGHVIQHVNKLKLPLRLFQIVGGHDSVLLAEGGANMIQNHITKQCFGFEQFSRPHYIRAYERRLAGGNYLECLRVYIESAMKTVKADQQEALLRTAINRTKRLFRDAPSFDGASLFGAQSQKDVVYIEQVKVIEELTQSSLESIACVGGIPLDSVAEAIQHGILSVEHIAKPRYYALHIWEQLKSQYF